MDLRINKVVTQIKLDINPSSVALLRININLRDNASYVSSGMPDFMCRAAGVTEKDKIVALHVRLKKKSSSVGKKSGKQPKNEYLNVQFDLLVIYSV